MTSQKDVSMVGSKAQVSYEGKAKRVQPRPDGTVAMSFKDDATAFNGQKHAQFPGKGALNSKISEALFVHLANAGIATHHLKRLDDITLLVQQAKMFLLEVVVRFQVAGSLAKRTGLAPGTPCPAPVVELYYKDDGLGDPLINDEHVGLLNLASPDELATMKSLGKGIAKQLHALFAQAQLNLIDIKFEFGRTDAGIVLADEISPDTCRLHDANDGTVLDKDRFRRDLGDLLEGYNVVWQRLHTVLGEHG